MLPCVIVSGHDLTWKEVTLEPTRILWAGIALVVFVYAGWKLNFLWTLAPNDQEKTITIIKIIVALAIGIYFEFGKLSGFLS